MRFVVHKVFLDHLGDYYTEILNIGGSCFEQLFVVPILGVGLLKLLFELLDPLVLLLDESVLCVEVSLVAESLFFEELDPAILLKKLLLHS